MIRENIKLAFVNLTHRKLRSWLTMIGIIIGIAAVVSLIGLGEGLRSAITGQFGFLGTDIISVQASGIAYAGPPGTGAIEPLDSDLAEKISSINGVEAAFNRYIETTTIEFNSIQTIAYVASIPTGDNRRVLETMMNLDVDSGRALKDIDDRKVVLGSSYAEEEVFGDQNVFKKPAEVGDTITINDVDFEVIGIYEKQGSFIFDGAIYMNENVMLDIFGDDDTTDVIAVKVEDVDEIDKVEEDLERLLLKERDVKKGEENFQISTPQQALESLNSALFAVQLFVYIIAGISLVIGGIGIMNTMYTAVIQRTKEIGIMKAIGAKNSTIFSLFFFESGFLGSVGGIIGVTLGMIIAYGLAFLGRLILGVELIQADISIYLIVGSLLFSFFLGTIFGVLPAIQAAKLHPVEALRK